jgi:alkylation response protein AidB-like acyl-CoA dehydrogenase
VDFAISDDQQALRDLARLILSEGATHERLQQLEGEGWAVFDQQLWRRLAEAGLTGIALAEEHGGGGLGFLELSLLFEEVGRTVAPVPAVPALATAYVLGRHKLVPDLLAGVAAGTTVVTTAFAAEVTVRRDGAGWRMSGEAPFVPYGEQAGLVVIPAQSDAGPVAVLLPDAAALAAVTTLATTNREPQALLAFDDVAIDAEQVLADAGELLQELRLHVTSGLCSVAAGVCAAALDMTAQHARTREQFGKPIASFQAVGQRAADAYIDTELVKLTALSAAWRLAEGWPAEEEVAVAKFWAGDGGMRALHACQHLHGGLGVDLDYPLHRYFLWGKQLEHELGTPTRQLLALGGVLAATPV